MKPKILVVEECVARDDSVAAGGFHGPSLLRVGALPGGVQLSATALQKEEENAPAASQDADAFFADLHIRPHVVSKGIRAPSEPARSVQFLQLIIPGSDEKSTL